MIRFAENLNKMITAGLGGLLEAPRTEIAVGKYIRYRKAWGRVATFESIVVAPIRSIRVDMRPIQAGSGDPSPENIRPITGRDAVTVYHSGDDITYYDSITVQLGQTVYGGTFNVVSGELKVDWAFIESYNGEEIPGEWISDRDLFAPDTTPTIGAQVCYRLSTSEEFVMDPVTLSTLEGLNQVWSDAGDVSLEYPYYEETEGY